MIERIKEIISPIIEEYQAFVVDIDIRGEKGSKVLEIFIDNIEGVTTELCADISRDIGVIIEREDLFKGKYYLNVSSPGLDKPLKFPSQYIKHKGRLIEVSYKINSDINKITAELLDATEKEIILRGDKEEVVNIKHIDIIKARIKTPW